MAEASEAFLFTRLIDALRVAEDCCRGMAIARSDTRWLDAGKRIGAMHDLTKRMAQANARQALHIIGENLAKH